MSNFKREDRYTVIKHNQLTGSQCGHLKDFLLGEGVPTVKSVVIESDWPEYEPVWSMIERRMSGQTEHVGVIVAKKWLESAPRAVSLVNGSGLPDGAYLYLAPPASSDLAEVTLRILKEAKDIPDGLYARASHLASTEQSQLAALREELTNTKTSLEAVTLNLSRVDDALFKKSLRLADAERRNAELEKNAARYIWLRDKSESVHQFYLSTPIWFTGVKFNQESVDSAIDAALNPKPEAASHDPSI